MATGNQLLELECDGTLSEAFSEDPTDVPREGRLKRALKVLGLVAVGLAVVATTIKLTAPQLPLQTLEPSEQVSLPHHGRSRGAALRELLANNPPILVLCDVKRPLAHLDRNLTEENYMAVLGGLKMLGCAGVRIGIDPKDHYLPIFSQFVKEARARGLVLFANPLGVGSFGKSDQVYAKWIADFVKAWQPEYYGMFNEPGMSTDRLISIAKLTTASLPDCKSVRVGPDMQHLDSSVGKLKQSKALEACFDVIASHNANRDTSATKDEWATLAKVSAGRPVWADEDPRPWNTQAGLPGVKEAVGQGDVSGIVLYEAFPSCVSEDGSLTLKGRELAEELSKTNKELMLHE